MDTTRQNKISRLIQKELSDIFVRESKEWVKNVMITVSVVRVTPDLAIAKVYLSVFPSERKDEVLTAVEENAKKIRGEMGNRVRNQLRVIPELHFFIDDSLDYIENIDKLLKS
jgi:ribosome-binding factor A